MKIRRFLASTIVFGFLAAAPARALDIAIEDFTLANGLRVVVIPSQRAPVVSHMVWYKVGAADEPKGKAGIAHFLEHLMFKGTPKHPAGEFSRIIRLNGGEENAATTQDYTVYFQKIASDRLPLVMELEADRMQNLVLTDENVLPELEVVREERRQRIENEPSGLLAEQVDAALYTAHPYGKPIIGWMGEVAKLSRQDAMDFYRAHYEPRNAIVVIAGDVEPGRARELAEKYYGVLKNRAVREREARTEEPAPIAERRITMRDERVTMPSIQRSYIAPSASRGDRREVLALQVLADIAGGGNYSRLYQDLVIDRKLAAYAGARYSPDSLDYGEFTLYAGPNPGVEPEKLEAEIDLLLAGIAEKGITEEELESTRNRVLADAIYLLDSQNSLARMFGSSLAVGQELKDIMDWDNEILTVTAQEVKDAARHLVDRRASVTAYLLPAEKK